MKVRLALALLLMLVVGGVAGYAVGAQHEPEPESRVSFQAATPVPAANPRVPVEIFAPDPDDSALATKIPLHDVTLAPLNAAGKPMKDQLTLPVPDGWLQSQPRATRWQFVVAGNDPLSFGLRIDYLGDRGQSIDQAMQSRESELRSALAQSSFADLEITHDDTFGFVATYVQDRHQRFSYERFYPGPDGLAYATVAVYGRARDVTGMADLLERISIDLRPTQRP